MHHACWLIMHFVRKNPHHSVFCWSACVPVWECLRAWLYCFSQLAYSTQQDAMPSTCSNTSSGWVFFLWSAYPNQLPVHGECHVKYGCVYVCVCARARWLSVSRAPSHLGGYTCGYTLRAYSKHREELWKLHLGTMSMRLHTPNSLTLLLRGSVNDRISDTTYTHHCIL